MSVLAWGSRQTKSDEFITRPTCCSLCVCALFCFIAPCAALHQLTFLSFALSFFSPPFFFISLISFTWRLFTCLSHSGQSVLPPCTVSSLLSLLFTLPARQSHLCFSFVWWTLFLSLDFVRWLRLTPSFGPSDRLQNLRPKCVLFSLHFWWFNVLHTAVESFILTTLDAKKLSSKDKSEMSEFFFFFMQPLQTERSCRDKSK